MKVKLHSVGNPDFGQNPNQPLYGCRNKTVKVQSLSEARQKCLDYINENDLGGGNWSGGEVINDQGEVIAYISYNGRVWESTNFEKEIVLS